MCFFTSISPFEKDPTQTPQTPPLAHPQIHQPEVENTEPLHPVHALPVEHPFHGMTPAQYDFFHEQQETMQNLSNQFSTLYLVHESDSLSKTLSKVKPHEPDTFHGQRSKLKPFIASLRIYFTFKAANFPTERSKVLFACSYFRDSAFAWAEPIIRASFDTLDAVDPILDDFEQFIHHLQQTFGDIDSVAHAERQIQSFRQISSVT